MGLECQGTLCHLALKVPQVGAACPPCLCGRYTVAGWNLSFPVPLFRMEHCSHISDDYEKTCLKATEVPLRVGDVDKTHWSVYGHKGSQVQRLTLGWGWTVLAPDSSARAACPSVSCSWPSKIVGILG